MRKFIVTCLSVSGRGNRIYKYGQVISETQLDRRSIPELIRNGFIRPENMEAIPDGLKVVIFSSPSRIDMLQRLTSELKDFDVTIIDSLDTFGKNKFWMRWEQARQICLASKYNDYLILPDDVYNVDMHTITELYKLFHSRAFVCSIISDGRTASWGSKYNDANDFQLNGMLFRDYGFFDCGGATNRITLNQIQVTRVPESWFKSSTCSSGVGYQLTNKLRSKKIPMLVPSNGLCDHGDHVSVMNPLTRINEPLISRRNMNWILQDKGFALGNFINVTPIILNLFLKTDIPVPVFFETEYVKKCYINNPFIRIMDKKPTNTPIASSSMINKRNDKPDYQYAYEFVTGLKYNRIVKPFIDRVNSGYESSGDYVLIMNGSGNNSDKYVSLKDPGVEIYRQIVAGLRVDGHKIVFTGNTDDLNRLESIRDLFDEIHINDIRHSLFLVKNARFIVTNDTGLAHAAGCYNTPQLVLWKHTKFEKNKNSGTKTHYAKFGQWMSEFNYIRKSI